MHKILIISISLQDMAVLISSNHRPEGGIYGNTGSSQSTTHMRLIQLYIKSRAFNIENVGVSPYDIPLYQDYH